MKQFQRMDRERAAAISTWKYKTPYELYSMDGSETLVEELLEEPYYYMLGPDERVWGYVCYGDSARVPGGYDAGIYDDDGYVDLGVGMHPDQTGNGNGCSFFKEVLHFLSSHLQAHKFRLVVAAFNKRAIRVYEKAGFQKGREFRSPVRGENLLFIEMRLEDSAIGGNGA